MSKQMYIYETTNLINGKKYIGKHIGELTDNYLGSGLLLNRAIKKYGKENFSKQILYIAHSLEELNLKEKEFIALFNAVSSENYYNIHEGGDGGNTTAGYNSEQKNELSKKFSEQRKGDKNPMYGKHHTEASKELIRKNRDTSYMQTKEYKEIMSKATQGEKNGMYGKHHTEESK